MNQALLRLLAIAALLIAPSMLLASETPISTCGTVITKSGTYAIDADLNCSGDGIDIEANNVKLLLSSHTISGPGINSGNSGVSVGGQVFNSVTILGPGTITNFSAAVLFYGTNGGGLVGVNLTGNTASVYVGSSTNLTPATSLLIAQNTCNGTGGGYALDLEGIEKSTIAGNNCSNNYVGILLAGSNNTLDGNTSSYNPGYGIQLLSGTGNTLRGNQFNSNQNTGIYTNANGNHFTGNLAQGNGSFDVDEQLADCSGDTYKNDAFVTANQSCVK